MSLELCIKNPDPRTAHFFSVVVVQPGVMLFHRIQSVCVVDLSLTLRFRMQLLVCSVALRIPSVAHGRTSRAGIRYG